MEEKDGLLAVQIFAGMSNFHFMSVLKIVHRSPGSHDNVIDMNFFCLQPCLKDAEYGRT